MHADALMHNDAAALASRGQSMAAARSISAAFSADEATLFVSNPDDGKLLAWEIATGSSRVVSERAWANEIVASPSGEGIVLASDGLRYIDFRTVSADG